MTNQEIIDTMNECIKKAKEDMFAAPVGEKRWDALSIYEMYKRELERFKESVDKYERMKQRVLDCIAK